MYTIIERPWSTQQIGFFARKNGVYNRPIIGDMVDFRFEDILPKDANHTHIIGKLPEISAIGQSDKYFISIYNDIEILNGTRITKFIESGDFVILPINNSSPLWKYTHAPWWEYVVVFDNYQGFIKAPREGKSRSSEPIPEEADELIDNYQENINNIKVLAPSTINKIRDNQIQESYISKLKRI